MLWPHGCVVFAFQATTTYQPIAFLLSILRLLARPRLRPAEAGGCTCWTNGGAGTVHQLFKQRPVALRRLHVVLSPSRLRRVLNRLNFWRVTRLARSLGLPSWQDLFYT